MTHRNIRTNVKIEEIKNQKRDISKMYYFSFRKFVNGDLILFIIIDVYERYYGFLRI